MTGQLPTGIDGSLLEGVRVVEVSGSLRAAFAGVCLRDLGATVVRADVGVARPGVPEECDRGKETVPVGPDRLGALLSEADAIVEDLDDDLVVATAARRTPRPLVVSVTGLGRTAERPNPPELCVQAASGVLWSIGRAGRSPLPVPQGVASTLAGVHAACATLWGLLRRVLATDEEPICHVDIAEADVVAAQLGTYRCYLRHYGGEWRAADRPADGGMGSTLQLGALVEASDGLVYLLAATQTQLERLHALLPEGFRREFPTYLDGVRRRRELIGWLAGWARSRTRREVLQAAREAGVVAAPFLGLDDLDAGGMLPLLRREAAGPPALPVPWMVTTPAETG